MFLHRDIMHKQTQHIHPGYLIGTKEMHLWWFPLWLAKVVILILGTFEHLISLALIPMSDSVPLVV